MKKLLSIILVLSMLFSVLSVLSLLGSCGDKKTEDTGGTQQDQNETPTEDTPEDTSYKADYLPEADYGGYEFRIVATVGYPDSALIANVEEETGDTVVDAIYKRNRLIEDTYNIKFKQIDVPDYPALTNTFKKSTAAGSDDFDLGMMISRDAWSTALTGAVVPVDKLPYLDITQPWYSHDVNSEISINGKLYFAYSDECLNMFGSAMCVLFNKALVQNLSLDNLYNLVKDNKWTIDKFFEFATIAASDVDGDGQMTDADRYGIVSQCDSLFPCFWVSSGIKTVSKDENDLLVFTGDNEKLYNVLEKVYQNIFSGDKIYYDAFIERRFAEEERAFSRIQFENNLGLFYIAGVGSVPALRAMETDFGILPFPKYDEAQEKYYSRVIDGWINCVPNFTTDLERTSAIMEALAVESKNITIPAYFETALRTKYSRDDESSEMLDIIHANRTMDLGDTFYMDPVRNIYVNELNAKKNNFTSAVEKSTNNVNKTLQKANESALELE